MNKVQRDKKTPNPKFGQHKIESFRSRERLGRWVIEKQLLADDEVRDQNLLDAKGLTALDSKIKKLAKQPTEQNLVKLEQLETELDEKLLQVADAFRSKFPEVSSALEGLQPFHPDGQLSWDQQQVSWLELLKTLSNTSKHNRLPEVLLPSPDRPAQQLRSDCFVSFLQREVLPFSFYPELDRKQSEALYLGLRRGQFLSKGQVRFSQLMNLLDSKPEPSLDTKLRELIRAAGVSDDSAVERLVPQVRGKLLEHARQALRRPAGPDAGRVQVPLFPWLRQALGGIERFLASIWRVQEGVHEEEVKAFLRRHVSSNL